MSCMTAICVLWRIFLNYLTYQAIKKPHAGNVPVTINKKIQNAHEYYEEAVFNRREFLYRPAPTRNNAIRKEKDKSLLFSEYQYVLVNLICYK